MRTAPRAALPWDVKDPFESGSRSGSWRVARRLAVRDIRTAKARSLLVVLIITLAGVATWVVGSRTMLYQDAASPMPFDGPRTTVSQAGLTPPGTPGPAAVVAPYTGTAPELAREAARIDVSGYGRSAARPVEVEQVDATDPLWSGAGKLRSGRWPTAAGEVASDRSLPLGTKLASDVGPLVVVGTASFTTQPTNHVVAGPGTLATVPTVKGLVLAEGALDGVDAATEERFSDLGLQVDGAQRSGTTFYRSPITSQNVALGTAGALFALLQVALLAATPFGVAARRQLRRSGLLVANGGGPVDVRRPLYAQALILGVVGTALGAAVGIPVALHLDDVSGQVFGGSRAVIFSILAVVLPMGAAIAAAVVPALTASRIPVVAALAGQRPSRPPHRYVPVVGAVLLVLGLVAITDLSNEHPAYSVDSSTRNTKLLGALVLCQAGALCLVVQVFALLRRFTGSWPVSLRLALADADRARGRTVPAVLGVVSVVVLAVSVLLSVDTSTPFIRTSGDGNTYTAAEITPSSDFPDQAYDPLFPQTLTASQVAAVRDRARKVDPTAVVFGYQQRYDLRNPDAGQSGNLPGPQVISVDDATLRSLGFTAADAAAFDSGTALAGNRSGLPTELLLEAENSVGQTQVTIPLRGVVLPKALADTWLDVVFVSSGTGQGFVRPGGAEVHLSLTTSVSSSVINGLAGELGSNNIYLEGTTNGVHERSALGKTGIILLLLAGPGLLALLLTVATTALAKTELDVDLATMSAVGAAPWARRRLAGAHALVVCLAGEGVGVVLAILGRSITQFSTRPVVGEQVGALVVWLLVLPLVTTAVGVLTTRSRPRPA